MFIDWLIDPSFQGVNRFFSLSFWDNADRTGRTIYSLPIIEMKDYNVMMEETFWSASKKWVKNIW